MGAPLCRCRKCLFTLLQLLLLLPSVSVQRQPVGPPLDCKKTCVCASNIISCSKANLTNIPTALPQYATVLDLSFNAIARLRAGWTAVSLDSLEKLLLNNNGLNFLSSEAFLHVTNLRYLDLSFNDLRQLDELIFEPLERLQVLLLYKNNISQIDRSAFSGLALLQRLYLSHNRIARFPLELVKEQTRLESLELLDVSSNRIKSLPVSDLLALPAWIGTGVFFHNNPLSCSCDLYEMVARWFLKDLTSAVDFTSSHTCVIPSLRKATVPVLDLYKAHLNCSEVRGLKEEAYLGQSLVLECDTKHRNMLKRWELPGNVTGAVMRPDGSLLMEALRVEDSGIYTCYATNDSLKETLYVTVVVFNSTMRGGLENINTAYTTLVGCLLSVVMVLFYLYFTPCRSACCSEKDDLGGSLQSSEENLSQAGGRRAATPEQNGNLNPIGEEDEEEEEDGRKRKGSDGESVCSDAPMVV
ncbi:amphoterin-induced protein 1 [Oryzias melastigma]|uniref:amphoterin-induced protein 1 n=1 Tax=Oryzias melastigma TaxID=30732 RepID=UPI000CF7CDA4|nr:amphoterin-induced protein 1 [Oryzias melastigma]